MAHVLVVGQTGSGKTTFLQQLAARFTRPVLVCDRKRLSGWTCAYQTGDIDDFIAVAQDSRACALIVDDAGFTLRRNEPRHDWLATESRNLGHRAYFLAQRPKQLAPTVRDQCSELILFYLRADDARWLAADFGRDEILEAPQLPQYHGIHVPRFGPVRRIHAERPA